MNVEIRIRQIADFLQNDFKKCNKTLPGKLYL